jgi:hypothetical protein
MALRGGVSLQTTCHKENEMATCEVCGNDYDKSFEVKAAGRTHTFDSFECAIHALAPKCDHCGCRIVGHGTEAAGKIYCCANCARESGNRELRDRA